LTRQFNLNFSQNSTMQLSNALSDAVLMTVCLFVFFRYFARVPFYNKLLWGIFLITVTLTAAAGVFRFMGITELRHIHSTLGLLAGTTGLAAAAAGIYGIALEQTLSRFTLIGVVTIGLVLFVLLLNPSYRAFEQVVASFTMLLAMVIAVFGLLRKNMKALWVVIGVMILGLATKVVSNQVPLNPTDVYHYALAAMVVCFGKAV
jgi:hypothetical protein